MRISVIGLGKLGLCSAACFAAAGHQVVGFDKLPDHLAALRRGECPIDEPELEVLLAEAGSRLRYVDSIAEAVAASEVTLIIVPTPSLPDGGFDNDHVGAVLEEVGKALRERSEFHVVDVVSTVMPGSCEGAFRPQLEAASGKRCGEGFGLVYNPEFIALGSVIRNFLHPDLVLIGASDARSGERVHSLYRETCRNRPAIEVMPLIDAEITKIALNSFVTMKISFANELATICERVPGADVDRVTAALGADSRIGGKYLRGGVGFGGPCFPRDNQAFQRFAREFGYEVRLAPQTVAVNREVPRELATRVAEIARPPARIALLGLSYKPGTHVVEESQSLELARLLSASGYRVAAHDPRAESAAAESLGTAVEFPGSVAACVAGAEVVVLLTEWPEYVEMDVAELMRGAAAGATLLDCWRSFRDSHPRECGYRAVGIGPQAPRRLPVP